MLINKDSLPLVAMDFMNNTHFEDVDLINEIYAWLCVWPYLLIQIAQYEPAQASLRFDGFFVHHFILLLLQWQPRTDMSYWNIIAFGQLPSQRALPGKHFDFDAV